MAGESSRINEESASQPDLSNASSEELQHRLDETRNSITTTVLELRNTMADEYENVRGSVSDALDWRTHVSRYPIAFSLGAMTIGFLLGTGASRMGDGHSYGHSLADTSTSTSSGITGSHVVKAIEHSHIYGQVTTGLSDLASHLVNEVVRLGRDTLIPSLIARLSDRIDPEHRMNSERRMSMGQRTGERFTE